MTDPRNVAHDKRVQQEKKHKGEDIAEGMTITPQPGKKAPHEKHASDAPHVQGDSDATGSTPDSDQSGSTSSGSHGA